MKCSPMPRRGHNMINSGMPGVGSGGSSTGFGFGAGSPFGDIFSDIFGDIFGGQQRGRGKRGDDLLYNLEISFEEATSALSLKSMFPLTNVAIRVAATAPKPGRNRRCVRPVAAPGR